IETVTEWIADIPYSAVYTENRKTLLWIVVCYGAFALYAAIKRRFKISVLIPVCVCVAGFGLLLNSMHNTMLEDEGTLAVMDVGNGECIALTSGENAVVIDCGSSGISQNAGSMLSSYLHSNGRNGIDMLILTHLHSDHANGVCRLLNTVEVGLLVLPKTGEEPPEILEDILLAAEENGVPVFFTESDAEYDYGEIKINIYTFEKDEEALAVSAELNGHRALIMGDAYKNTELELADREDLTDTELLVVSHHGSKYASCEAFLNEVSPVAAVISTGTNSYGHPAQETLDRLAATEAELFRTDLNGRIIMQMN
ncbi:MAG: MBL fold metallo-hydrolase, partial [Ruminiclostridium sp.]|nr:MBL fold metallo-hydrolase [Ruminiclostridium sp.]